MATEAQWGFCGLRRALHIAAPIAQVPFTAPP